MNNPKTLENITDTEALAVLRRLAAASPDYSAFANDLSPLSNVSLEPAEQAQLARENLQALLESPEQRPIIEAMLNNHSARQFDSGLLSIPILFAIVFLQRTHIKYTRKSDGTWEFQIENKPSDGAALTQLLKKLSGLLP